MQRSCFLPDRSWKHVCYAEDLQCGASNKGFWCKTSVYEYRLSGLDKVQANEACKPSCEPYKPFGLAWHKTPVSLNTLLLDLKSPQLACS